MRIRDIVLGVAGRIAQYTTVARSTAKGFDFVTLPIAGGGVPSLGIAAEPDNQSQARRLQDFGLRSVPPAGSEAAVICAGGGTSNKMIIATENLNHGPLDLKIGEAALYNSKSGTVIKLDVDGKITITAGPNQDVVVNGGSLNVARKSDPIRIVHLPEPGGFLALWMSQVETAINILASGSVLPLSTAFLDSPGVVIKDGATHFKG